MTSRMRDGIIIGMLLAVIVIEATELYQRHMAKVAMEMCVDLLNQVDGRSISRIPNTMPIVP